MLSMYFMFTATCEVGLIFVPILQVKQMRLVMPVRHNQTPGEDRNFVETWNVFDWGPFHEKEDNTANTKLVTKIAFTLIEERNNNLLQT